MPVLTLALARNKGAWQSWSPTHLGTPAEAPVYVTCFDAPLHTAVEIHAKYRGDKVYCLIVCIKSLIEQVRKCCPLWSVSFQHVFFSGSWSKPYNSMKRKQTPKFQGSRRSPVLLSYIGPAILTWLHVTLLRGIHTPCRKGRWHQAWISLGAKCFRFALVCTEDRLRLST